MPDSFCSVLQQCSDVVTAAVQICVTSTWISSRHCHMDQFMSLLHGSVHVTATWISSCHCHMDQFMSLPHGATVFSVCLIFAVTAAAMSSHVHTVPLSCDSTHAVRMIPYMQYGCSAEAVATTVKIANVENINV